MTRLIYIKRNSKLFYPNRKRVLRHKKNFLVARQKKATRKCEISIIMENRINKCNISISTLFFSLYTRLEHKNCIPMRQTGEDAYNFVIPIQNIFTLVVSLALCAHKESPPDTRIIVFTFSFIFKEGRLNKYLKETYQRIF